MLANLFLGENNNNNCQSPDMNTLHDSQKSIDQRSFKSADCINSINSIYETDEM